jgi:predicted cobalt transporter CbtA
MVRTLLVRGMLVGIVAGLLSFVFLRVYGEPQVDTAIAFESHMATAHSHDHAHAAAEAAPAEEGPALVSRQVQAGLGLFVGVMVYAVAFGGLFGLAFAFVYGRVPGAATPQGVSLLLAAAGFVAIHVVPSLKYPANPPAVGAADTIGTRTALYVVMIAVSIAAMIGALMLKRLLVRRLGDWNSTLAVVAYYVAIVAIAGLLLPAVDEVPEHFPAVVLWKFRVASIGAQLIMWATLGLLFGAWVQHAAVRGAPRA